MVRESTLFILLIVLITFPSCNNKQVVKEYYADGNLKKKIYSINYEINKVENYFPDGSLSSRLNFSNYEKGDCVITVYFIDGNIEGILNYKNGEKHGKQIGYDGKGNILFEETYNYGVLVD